MAVLDWVGPPPFGGRAQIIFGRYRPSASALNDDLQQTKPASRAEDKPKWLIEEQTENSDED